jgi:hypothetical protein
MRWQFEHNTAIRSDIIGHRDALLQRTNRFEMMRFNKTIADDAIALRETQITGLAARAMEFFSRPGHRAITLNFTVIRVSAGFDDGR